MKTIDGCKQCEGATDQIIYCDGCGLDFCSSECRDIHASKAHVTPAPFCLYQLQAVQYARIYGFEKTAAIIGLGKTTLYRWQKELK